MLVGKMLLVGQPANELLFVVQANMRMKTASETATNKVRGTREDGRERNSKPERESGRLALRLPLCVPTGRYDDQGRLLLPTTPEGGGDDG